MAETPITQTELSKLIGISQPMISKHLKSGKIPAKCTVKIFENGKDRLKIYPSCAKKALDQNTNPLKRKKKIPQKEPDQATIEAAGLEDLTHAEALTKKEQYIAALKKLEYESKEGLLISAEAVDKQAFEAGRQIRDSLQAIPDRCSAQCAAETDKFKIKQILLTEINFILTGLSEKIAVKIDD